jgi:hypothetical protein
MVSALLNFHFGVVYHWLCQCRPTIGCLLSFGKPSRTRIVKFDTALVRRPTLVFGLRSESRVGTNSRNVRRLSVPHDRFLTPVVMLALLVTAHGAVAQDVVAPANQRYSLSNANEAPDFQRHVVPLLGRLGCNGRACHGSFQGRGGFRLSLFGFDFKMDHSGLTGNASSQGGARVNSTAATESLILQKPLLLIEHEGGRRFDAGSWQHHLLQRWIESGSPTINRPRELNRLEVEPSEVVFQNAKPVSLRVVAVWGDGYREDVTCLCRFRTNDDSVVTVDADGRLKLTGAGDTHVIAFYDNGVVGVPVMRAVSEPGDSNYPVQIASTKVDEFILAKLAKLGLVPSPPCSDAEFLRRVSIDMTGTLPTPDEIETFLTDSSKDKWNKKIDELLKRPAFSAWWANRLCDFTGCNPRQQAELGQELAVQWYDWIYERLRENTPYDELIGRIVLAVGRSDGQTYDDYAKETSSFFRDESPTDFTQRLTMPHYWSRRTLNKPEEKALSLAHSFLGIRLQCAQCHKHPWDQWTQDDFKQFTVFFNNVRFGVAPESDARYRELAKQAGVNVRSKDGSPLRPEILANAQGGQTVPWRELYIAKRPGPVDLSLLRSRTVKLGATDDPRQPIMDWMIESDNPWFARAFVNRVWAGYFNVGIVDPPDDMSAANPPANPDLLNWLTTEFVNNEYDMMWLHRQIVTSDAYQRSWRPNETNREDRRNYSRAIPRRIPAEVVYDGLKQATASTDKQMEVRSDLSRRAIGHLSMRLAGTYAMRVFGKPERAVNCDCERDNKPTLLQAIFLQNDPLVEQRLESSGWLEQVAAREQNETVNKQDLVRTAYLRTVGRPPTEREIQRATKHIDEADSITEGTRDLLWALINTKEFILNR